MPCDIGYRSTADVAIDQETRTKALEIDAELLADLGVSDPVFAAWAKDLDIDPLLERALERTRAAVDPGEVAVSIANGALVTRAAPGNERLVQRLIQRWQLEVLAIVCELLDYDVAIASGMFEAEKHGATGVHQYIAVSFAAGGAQIRFEHFASDEELALEQTRFRALAQKLGIRIRILRDRRAGQKIPPGTIHPHKHRGKA